MCVCVCLCRKNYYVHAFWCTHKFLWSQIKTDFIHSLSAARMLSVLQIYSAATGLLMMLTFYIFIFTCSFCERGEPKRANTRQLHIHAHTCSSTSSNCNETDLFICDDVCRRCVFVREGDGLLLISPTHTYI